MDQYEGLRLPPAGQRTAARQAAALFLLSGVLAFVGIPHSPGPASTLVAIGIGDVAFAVLAWVVPWHRTGPDGPVLLALPAFVILAYSTWAFGGFAAGTGPFFVLVFAWLGLNFSPRAIVALILPATAAYLVPLALTDQPPQVLASALVLVPIAVGIGLLVARQVDAQRRDRATLAAIERWRAGLTVALAHDLRSPLTSVHLVLDALRADEGHGAEARGARAAAATAVNTPGPPPGGPDPGGADPAGPDPAGPGAAVPASAGSDSAGPAGPGADAPAPGAAVRDSADPAAAPPPGDRLTPQERIAMLDNALRQVTRLSRLSAVLLDADRVDSQGTLRLDLAEVALADLVRDVLDQLNAPDVQVALAPDVTVTADRERLEQILVNLVSNARRHGAPPVELRAEAVGDTVRIQVRDHGPGLPPALRDRAFSRFAAGHSDAGSVGLGLWIARELARAHGGDIAYEPARPGALLVVTLPRAGPTGPGPAGPGPVDRAAYGPRHYADRDAEAGSGPGGSGRRESGNRPVTQLSLAVQ
ncbi:MAG TPA: HAMP domain-containing sensor histidine kinase [Pilimelia sp.]|nr:HAMP domain-containing sensor histidine kinase [Pilimelia sp.]